MKTFCVAMSLGLTLLGTVEARAQLGLYGSPEPLPLASIQPAVYGAPAQGEPALANPLSSTPAPSPGQMPYGVPAGQATLPPPPENAAPAPNWKATGCEASGFAVTPAQGPAPNCGRGDACETGWLGCAAGCGDGCGICMPWYASVYALGMTRNKPNSLWTSYSANNDSVQGHYDDFGWTPGGEVTIGRRFGCCCEWAVEATFWGLSESSTTGGPGIAGPYSTPLHMANVDIVGTGTTANQWFDGSPNHQTQRVDEYYDVEINLVRNLFGQCGCEPWSFDLLAGIRYFRFRDRLVFSSEYGAGAGKPNTYVGGSIYLNDEVENNFIGGQIGFNLDYRFARCWKAFLTPKFGIYDNHVALEYDMYAVGPQGQYYQASAARIRPTYPDYPVRAGGDRVSFLTQIDVGLDWQITQHLGARFGYRLIAATGVALSDNQVPYFGDDTLAISGVSRNGDLVLHGAFAGLTYQF